VRISHREAIQAVSNAGRSGASTTSRNSRQNVATYCSAFNSSDFFGSVNKAKLSRLGVYGSSPKSHCICSSPMLQPRFVVGHRARQDNACVATLVLNSNDPGMIFCQSRGKSNPILMLFLYPTLRRPVDVSPQSDGNLQKFCSWLFGYAHFGIDNIPNQQRSTGVLHHSIRYSTPSSATSI
jgi:hypothetical protein